jgi:glycine oxidase
LQDTIVVGGGVIGLSVARDLASAGRSVLVLERGVPGGGASWAAAGMLSPQSDAGRPGPFFDLGMAGLRMYGDWIESLRDETGMACGYTAAGSLRLAGSAAEASALDEARRWQVAAGLRAETLSPKDVLGLEPRLAMPIAGALWLPDESQVTPRRLTQALESSCARRGVAVGSGQGVEAISISGGRAAGVRVAGSDLHCAEVVVASGAWSGGIAGLDPAIPVFPRKGQILSLGMPEGAFNRPICWEGAYAVPRPGGELVIGATNEAAGFDRNLTPAGLEGLLREAQRLAPDVGRYPIREMWSGLRPATSDGLPIIGRAAIDGLFYATGHYRNGILLAPITAALLSGLIVGGSLPVSIDAFSPMRFQ